MTTSPSAMASAEAAILEMSTHDALWDFISLSPDYSPDSILYDVPNIDSTQTVTYGEY